MFYFTPLPGFFSPFPHGTNLYRSPSSIQPYGVGPTSSYEVSRASHYSGYYLSNFLLLQDFHLLWFAFPNNSSSVRQQILQSFTPKLHTILVWALPISLATTLGIEFSFFSCRYLDVSVPCVPFLYTTLLMYGLLGSFSQQSFLIRISMAITDICSLPQLFAAYHVLLRLLVPRYPPYALCSLTSCFR